MELIFAIDKNWNIGYKGDMLFSIPADLKRFKNITQNNIIIMGRKTFESLPNKQALPNRINIVITREKNYKAENTIIVNSLDEMFSMLLELNPYNKLKSYIIGGGEITSQLLPYCNKAYITKVNKSFNNTDVSIPNLDKYDDWEIHNQSESYIWNGLRYRYIDYIRVDRACNIYKIK